MNDPREMIAAYFEGRLNADQVAGLEAWLREDRERARTLIREAMLDNHLSELLHEANLQEVSADLSDDSKFGATFKPAQARSAETPSDDALLTIQYTASNTLTKQKYVGALSYVLRHTFTPKRLTLLATAAALLLGVVLAIVLITSNDGPSDLAQAPDLRPATPTPEPNRVVATVTDQVNAQWVTANGQGALPDRMLLAINQRLTLAQGFAEITTKRGAKVLVQAPATIETTDSGNAIRLHRGKLVGRCDTPSSKGFTVHAPGMDVVDLGTVFAVSADAENGSTVTVIEGSVRAEPAETSPLAFEPVVLEQDEARRVEPETGGLEAIALAEAPVFYEAIPHPYVTAVLDAAPVAYWRFEDNQARTVVNEINPGKDDLSMVGPATLTRSGIVGKAGLLTNRAEPYGHFETTNPIDQLANFEQGTIEFWYYADVRLKQQEGYDAAMLLSLYDPTEILSEPGATSKELIALELTDDAWLFDQERIKPIGWLEYSIRVYPDFFIENERRRALYTDHAHPVQQWQHVVLVKEAETITLYLDGERVEAMPHAFGPISPLTLRLGRTFDYRFESIEDRPNFKTPPRPFLGRLDEVALYDKPLTAEQVARHYSLATNQDQSP